MEDTERAYITVWYRDGHSTTHHVLTSRREAETLSADQQVAEAGMRVEIEFREDGAEFSSPPSRR